MNKILLLGATGKIGKCVLRLLQLESGYAIGVLIRNLSTKKLNETYTNLKIFEGDLTVDESIDPAINWADVVINCSGYVSYKRSRYEREKLRLINVEAVKNVVDSCIRYNKKLIHTSSTGIYGCIDEPILLKENTTYDRVYRTQYSYSKIEAENIVLSANIGKIILRPSSLMSKEKSTIKSFYDFYRKGFVAGFKGGSSFVLMEDTFIKP